MQNELENLLHLPKNQLSFTDQHVYILLNNLGSIDPHLRDNLSYSLLARGFQENSFNKEQLRMIIDFFINKKTLFHQITEPENDAVFLRTFTALLGALILAMDSDQTILTNDERQTIFNWSIAYLELEKDYRSFVKNKGWAHSIAHGSDFLAATLRHPKFIIQDQIDLLNLIRTIFNNMQITFVDDEEKRLAYAFFQGLKTQKFSTSTFIEFINEFNTERYQKLANDNLLGWHQLSTWLAILQSWYFLLEKRPELQVPIANLIEKYYDAYK